MALGYGLQMATIVQPSNRMDVSTRQELKNKIELSTRIQASTFVRADCATQVQVLQALIASSRIVVETDAGEEYLAEIAEIAEGDYDSEVDFIDDDEIRDEEDSFGAYAAPNGEEASPLDSILRGYEIRIVEKAPRRWACIPPRNPLLGYRPNGFDSEAHKIREAVRKQFAFYESVAKWLQSEGNEVLESPAAFRGNHKTMTQTGFVTSEFCANFRSKKAEPSKKADTGNIHAYCQNCRLSWGYASLPLSSVFTK